MLISSSILISHPEKLKFELNESTPFFGGLFAAMGFGLIVLGAPLVVLCLFSLY